MFSKLCTRTENKSPAHPKIREGRTGLGKEVLWKLRDALGGRVKLLIYGLVKGDKVEA